MTARIAIGPTWVLALGVLLVSCIPSPSLASPYKITVVDGATNLNDKGELAGYFYPPGPSNTIYYRNPYTHSTSIYDSYSYFHDSNPGGKTVFAGITSPSGGNSGSYDFKSNVFSLNNSGQALGSDSQGRTALFDTSTGRETPLSFLNGTPMTGDPIFEPSQLVDSGRIYGNENVDWIGGGTRYHPYVYENGETKDLGVPPGMLEARFIAANNAQQVLVLAAGADGLFNQSFLLSNGAWTKLGNFQATGINDRGDIVGIAQVGPDSYGRTVLLPSGSTTPIDIGTLPGQTTVFPSSINDKGEIVGVAFTRSSTVDYHAFLYRNGVMTDLNSLIEAGSGWSIRWGVSINDRGQILASAEDGQRNHTLLLTPDGLPTPRELVLPELPVPEPSTFLVFGVIAAGFVWRRSRP